MQFLWLWDSFAINKSPWANSLMHLWWNFSFSAMFSLLNLKVNSSFISSTLHWVSWSGRDNKILASAAVLGVAESDTTEQLKWTELSAAPREDTEPAFISGDHIYGTWFTCQDHCLLKKKKNQIILKQSGARKLEAVV